MGTAQRDVSRNKQRGGGLGGPPFFSHSLTSRRTPLSERLEQASHHISDRTSKRASSDCVLCIPIIVTGSPRERVAGYLSAVHIMNISKLEIRIAVAFGRP